ncbi:MAG: hypothetical protein CM1200mP36_07170 [Gammaproteobacteria bacterium]|nr:MAG: hypothetical protein CM1200mP36_07170 [Gammaproteobacteria bacterium]
MTERKQLEAYLGEFRQRLRTSIVARGLAVLCVGPHWRLPWWRS